MTSVGHTKEGRLNGMLGSVMDRLEGTAQGEWGMLGSVKVQIGYQQPSYLDGCHELSSGS